MCPSSHQQPPDSSAGRAPASRRRVVDDVIVPVTVAAPAAAGAEGRREGRVVARRYQLRELLGRGAMGEVWRARHCALDVDFAIKFLSLSSLGAPRGQAAALARERFRFEAQVAAQLGLRTRGIVVVRDVGEDEQEGPFLVMEYVRGRTLRQELDERRQLEPRQLLPWLEDIAEALAVVHGLGIVHRDIKPSNVLLGEAPGERTRARIADFGIAKGLSPDLSVDLPRQTGGEVKVGTPAYMSPEMFWDARVNPGADLWALAVMAHEALTGKRPFQGRNAAEVLASILAEGRTPPSTLCPSLPPALDAWFERAFALDPEERFGSVQEMVTAYRAAIEPGASTAQRAPAALWKKRALVAGGVLAAVVAALPFVLPLAGLQVGGGATAAALQPVGVHVGEVAPARLDAARERPGAATPEAAPAIGVEAVAPAWTSPGPASTAAPSPDSVTPASAGRPARITGARPAAPPATSASGRATRPAPRRAGWKSAIF